MLKKIFNNLTKVQIATFAVLLLLLAAIPLAIFLTKQQQEIRPRAAISGQVDFHLTGYNENPKVGDEVAVNVTINITSPTVKVSGLDFRVLYDKSKFESNPKIEPYVGTDKPFTDTILTQVDQPWSDTLNYLRVVLVSRKLTPALPGGSNIAVATLRFKAKANGQAVIKFPDQNQDANGVDLLQVSGIDLIGPTAAP